jgi:hypothetical protein
MRLYLHQTLLSGPIPSVEPSGPSKIFSPPITVSDLSCLPILSPHPLLPQFLCLIRLAPHWLIPLAHFCHLFPSRALCTISVSTPSLLGLSPSCRHVQRVLSLPLPSLISWAQSPYCPQVQRVSPSSTWTQRDSP